MKITKLDALQARAMFAFVVGTINGAELHSGFAILDMGKGAHAVIVAGQWVGCCPTRAYAKRLGERHANEALVEVAS